MDEYLQIICIIGVSALLFIVVVNNCSNLSFAQSSSAKKENKSLITNPPMISDLLNISNAKIIGKEQLPTGPPDLRINPPAKNVTVFASRVGYIFDNQIWICEYDDDGNWIGCDIYELQ